MYNAHHRTKDDVFKLLVLSDQPSKTQGYDIKKEKQQIITNWDVKLKNGWHFCFSIYFKKKNLACAVPEEKVCRSGGFQLLLLPG